MSPDAFDHLSVEELLEIAAGVLHEVEVRDAGLLAAAAARPGVTVFGDEAYPTFEDKVAALLHSLVRNHALVDGNKHLAWSAARIFCLLTGRGHRSPGRAIDGSCRCASALGLVSRPLPR